MQRHTVLTKLGFLRQSDFYEYSHRACLVQGDVWESKFRFAHTFEGLDSNHVEASALSFATCQVFSSTSCSHRFVRRLETRTPGRTRGVSCAQHILRCTCTMGMQRKGRRGYDWRRSQNSQAIFSSLLRTSYRRPSSPRRAYQMESQLQG